MELRRRRVFRWPQALNRDESEVGMTQKAKTMAVVIPAYRAAGSITAVVDHKS